MFYKLQSGQISYLFQSSIERVSKTTCILFHFDIFTIEELEFSLSLFFLFCFFFFGLDGSYSVISFNQVGVCKRNIGFFI